MEDKIEKNKKKIYIAMLLIVILMTSVVSATYAFYVIDDVDQIIDGTAAAVDLELTVTRETPTDDKLNASTKIMIPQPDASLSTAMNTTNNCVDGNNNIVCQVLKITITNNSTAAVQLNGTIHFTTTTGGTFNNLYWRETTDATTMGTNPIYKAAASADVFSEDEGEANALFSNKLSLNALEGTKTYYLVIWISETGTSQNKTDAGTWIANINFVDSTSGNGVTSTIIS